MLATYGKSLEDGIMSLGTHVADVCRLPYSGHFQVLLTTKLVLSLWIDPVKYNSKKTLTRGSMYLPQEGPSEMLTSISPDYRLFSTKVCITLHLCFSFIFVSSPVYTEWIY